MLKLMQIMAGAEHGGAETAFVDNVTAFAKAQREGGFDVEQRIIIRTNPERAKLLEEAGITPIQLPFGGLLDFTTRRRIKREIRAFVPDIVHSWMNRATKLTPHRTSGQEHVMVGFQGGYYKLKYYNGKVDYLTVPTPHLRNYQIDKGWDAERIVVIRHFLPQSTAPVQPINRAEFGTPDDAPLFISLGRLHKKKGFDLLIDVAAKIPEAYIWIAGEGEERPQLEQRIEELQLRDRVKLLGWRNDREALLKTADYCVFPSRYEPFGIVTVEAWATKTPLIACNAIGPKEHIAHEKDGLLVEIDDHEGLRSAMQRFIDEPDFAQKLAVAGYETYQNGFTEKAAVEAYKDFYTKITTRVKS